MGSPLENGFRVPILASGPAAEAFRDLMAPWGMRIELVGERVGVASGIKIIRSVVAKGLEALLVECALGARRYGIDEAVLASFGKFMDQRPFVETANLLLVTNVIHAERRAEEAAMSADALAEIGVEPIMTRSTAERLRWVANLGMKAYFSGAAPRHYQEAIDAIETRLVAAAGTGSKISLS
jgi:3-hydroxyisobutyrate dehydrogenase-like beta-hydroxyacid dehydrogenase